MSDVYKATLWNFYFTYCKNIIEDIVTTWEKFLSYFIAGNQEQLLLVPPWAMICIHLMGIESHNLLFLASCWLL